ncbi:MULTISPECIES: Holliday junction branch migration protein RuvA [Desulfococcus]|jgi:Holliday junction DNA helicase RuvA|uniref:Holliday junction branch migration complex subunit RuvA n=1 Tax=Desulfococcus multivorans DSM 2059 TaxID=1121405 RepID=S7TS68_DESML|nr:Holliday junction branch migration protein RuvA [Desulfococcus multivorans]AOY59487.1 RuvA: holliday junction ATP-dependent DNA helicase, subunit alpha [Desulfococcus multivorans]AQV01687.1 Holliday junction DNA helicase RuvA [Desulfococcus multivorans]EPR40002.1 Holliday junction ATP-dependent DNA helicase ruvA [Desulfococcus multivorans DSM 2059]MDX9817413.1 Holliday junction branch migration protein RuvA [Desulfococcus multivorans]SKA01593.1 Holliday junction DNA helicase subunit RuvA [D
MIAYLEGTVFQKEDDRILLLVNHVGYEVMLPFFVMKTLDAATIGDQLALFIYYHHTERQPAPILIGFNSELEKEFFLQFISVEAIGPLKAVKALNQPISDIANAIETGNTTLLKNLKGIGVRTAQKIIATLGGKMGKFTSVPGEISPESGAAEAFVEKVLDVLVEQLGHKTIEARQMITEALDRNQGITTPEQLFDEIYRGNMVKSLL